jgi:hypothetical protein
MSDYFDTPNLEHKMKKYPCYTCLVRAACTEYIDCELVTKNKRNMFFLISAGVCPDCGQKTINRYNKFTFICSTCNHKFKEYVCELMERI